MNIGLYGTELKDDFLGDIKELIHKLNSEQAGIFIYTPFAEILDSKGIEYPSEAKFQSHQELTQLDMLLSIGGDGTFLSTLTLVRDSKVPVLGINTGRLGFLAYVATENIQKSMEAILNGRYSVKQRSLIAVTTPEHDFDGTNYALNEVAVHKKDTSSMVIIHIEIDGKFLNSYWADGLIISTPTGSTAYNLSCGGPIVSPNTECLIITPKAPHNLTVRPLVVKDDVEIKMRVECREENQFLLSLDSRSFICESQTEILLKKSDFTMDIVRPEGSSFFRTMRKKMKWGVDTRN